MARKNARSDLKPGKPAPAAPGRLVTVLDFGSSKIACVMGLLPQATDTSAERLAPRIVAIGEHRSAGVRAGLITNLAAAEHAVQGAVAEAERQSGLPIDEVYLTVNCGRPRTEVFIASGAVAGRTIVESDLARTRAEACRYAERDGRALLHLHEYGFRLDGAPGIAAPHGMVADRLGIEIAALTVDSVYLRTIEELADRCYLQRSGLVAAAYASGISVLSADEIELGACVIDLGGGTTSFAVFADGQLLHADAIPSGGDHVTLDIARNIATPRQDAERIKALYGTLQGASSDGGDYITYPLAGETGTETEQTTRLHIRELIEPRLEQVLGEVRFRLDQAGLLPRIAGGFVLTGGGSQMQGLRGYASGALGSSVRLGVPRGFDGTPEAQSPTLSAALGVFAVLASVNVQFRHDLGDAATGPLLAGQLLGGDGSLVRLGRWFKSSFWDDEQSRPAP